MESCFECGSTDDLHAHHVVPRSLGGKNTVPLCGRCHGLVHEHPNIMSISARTKAALAAKKAAGAILGNRTNLEEAQKKAAASLRAKGEAFAAGKIADIQAKVEAGMTLREIAAWLNEMGVKTARGGQWYASTVSNILKRG